MSRYTEAWKAVNTPRDVTESISGRNDMVKNAGGGYSFAIDNMSILKRFLIMGSFETYRPDATVSMDIIQNTLIPLLQEGRGVEIVRLVEEVNTVERDDNGRFTRVIGTINKNPSIWTLAFIRSFNGYTNDRDKKQAYEAVHEVIRSGRVLTGRNILEFFALLTNINEISRGKRKVVVSQGMRSAIFDYLTRNLRKTAYQTVKYRAAQEDGQRFTWNDVLRITHPKPQTAEQDAVFAWLTDDSAKLYNLKSSTSAIDYILAFEEAQKTDNARRLVELIHQFGLTHEAVPNQWNKHQDAPMIWKALLGMDSMGASSDKWSMPVGAIIRNLSRFSSLGLIPVVGKNDVTEFISGKLLDEDALKSARIHPIKVYAALKAYESGRGIHMNWDVNRSVLEMLDDMFNLSFNAIPQTGRTFCFVVDTSGSMTWNDIPGLNMKPLEAAAIMSMGVFRSEPDRAFVGAVSTGFTLLNISSRDRLPNVYNTFERYGFGETNLGAAIEWAIDLYKRNGTVIDLFATFTDNEGNSGKAPDALLDQYRQLTGHGAKAMYCAMTSSYYSMADPKRNDMLDVQGFDANVPAIIQGFALNEI